MLLDYSPISSHVQELVHRRSPGERLATPLWLTDTNYPAPCPCGEPFLDGDQVALITTEWGLKRMVHVQCMGPDMLEA